MSGSSDPYPAQDTDCSRLFFTTVLASPNGSVTSTLGKGDLLSISTSPGRPNLVVAKTAIGDYAGTITTHAARLTSCMERGSRFEAEVVDAHGAFCSIQVRPK
jgi:hypothetical protein